MQDTEPMPCCVSQEKQQKITNIDIQKVENGYVIKIFGMHRAYIANSFTEAVEILKEQFEE